MRTVEKVMSTTLISAGPNDLVGPVRDAMLDSGVHCLPVIDDSGGLVGIVSAWDLVEEYSPDEGIANAMTTNVLTIGPSALVEEAAAMMCDNFVHHLVVLDGNDREGERVVGVVSSFDLLGELAGVTP